MKVMKLSLTAALLVGASAFATAAFAQAPAAPPAAGAPAAGAPAAGAAPAAPAITFDNMDMKIKTYSNLGTVEATENICQAADGSLFVSLINVSKVMKVDPAGKATEFASVPGTANLLGVGCGSDPEVAAVVFGKTFRGTPAVPATATAPAVPAGPNNFADNDVHVHVYDLSGKETADIPLPKGMGLNGWAAGGNNLYYGGNSGKPEIDVVNTKTKMATLWYDAKDYAGPPPVPPAGPPIAVNGVKVIPGWVYFRGIKPGSNPAVPGIYRIAIGADGKPMGTPQTIQEGLATDDFGVAPDGSVILPSGTTIYKITAAGMQTKIADPAVGGPSLVVSKDGKTAYWPTRVAGTATMQRVLSVAIP